MKAITLSNPGQPSTYIFKEIPIPSPLPGHVVIKIKAFGLNHAEIYMRHGDWPETAEISGIECVGTVHSSPEGTFVPGTKVTAVMGGMDRNIPGSYAEYTRVPIGNNLELTKGQTLLVRGGTSALGQAAINLTVNAGANVIATTRNAERVKMLLEVGVHRVELESAKLAVMLSKETIIDSILNLIGNGVILDSLAIVRRGGRMPTGVHFSFFGSFVYGTPRFPLSYVPLQRIANDVSAGRYIAKPSRVFDFEEIEEAHKMMEENRAGGKMVVKVG
ncbi:hypothetical protein ACEPPN_007538 [Leptodophora sp. 'Broadleaf-Isolate-01']